MLTEAGIEDLWNKYQVDIVTKAGTISLETSMWIYRFISAYSPKSACDIGSGFTSILLREAGIPDVVTYEMDEKWAAKLTGRGYDIRPMDRLGERTFDFVIVDSKYGEGSGWDRADMPGRVVKAVNPTGHILFDDYNWPSLFNAIRRDLGVEQGWPIQSLENETRDKYHRYAAIVGPCGEADAPPLFWPARGFPRRELKEGHHAP